ncbi:Ig-like domain-containing protein [Pseudomonas sp. V88_4]|uniref:Ig-like domain-containing protein n=1 Tax=Pseudomonas sp. V88_4 TaxID=3044229 RepID=UPI00249DD778|nr:Ig-like domain-containing protein [Pseudomonas sp. V88_4]MDI3400093.1 Ig-like domain-containing protein [Pseudomonas sp. V88_4]
MTTSTPPDNTVLVLSPPIVNGQTTPVAGAHIGVPLVAYDLVTDGEGAVVLVDPPLAGNMDPDDVMELWLENETAALDSETIVDPDVRTTLRIPKGRLHPDKVNMLYYTVRRGSANRGTSTPPLEILYNRIRPGLKDRLTDPGGHSELKLLLPDAIKNGVGPDFVSAEVCVAYPYCRAYDLITLKCNGELLEPKPKVDPNQAPQPPNPGDEIPITICFTITRAYLDKAKRQDKKLHFSYTITDQLGNSPDTDAPWSPVQTVDEDLDGTRLPMAILLERMEDYPGDDAEEIDLVKLAGKPLLLVVLTIDPRFVAGYEVIATYTAKNTGQPADVVVTVSGKVEADPFGQKKPCILEVPNNKIFAGSNVIVTYELRKPNGDLVGTSKLANATVTGTAPVNLKPPTLVAPATNPIDVLSYENGVTVRVEHLSALPGDQARLLEVNPLPGTEPFPLLTLNENKRANFKLDPAFLVARRGTTIKLRWELVRGGKPEDESTDLALTIRPVAENDPRLPTPNIAGNTSSELKVQELTTDARILAAKWPLFEPGQPIWVTCSGFDKNGNPVSKEVRSGELNDSVDGLSVEAPVEWLKGLKDGTELTTKVEVNLDRIVDADTAVALPLRTYTVKALHPFTIEPALMELNGLNVNADFLALTGTPAPGTTQTRVPTSGDGGYYYFSNATDVATVNGVGLVSGLKNGDATITVRENSTQREVSFPVKVQNVVRLVMTPTHTYSISAAINWMNSIGGSPVSNTAIDVLKIKYRPLVSSAGGWLCRNDGCGAGQYLAVATNNPNAWSIVCFTGNNSQAHGWCLLPG